MNIHRRTLDNVEYAHPSEILDLIKAKSWPYKTNIEYYEDRDRALMSLLYLTCGRISEVLSLTKKQFFLDEEPDFIIVKNMIIKKLKKTAKKKRKAIRDEVPLPKLGPLAEFTEYVEN